jgi:hypothetical protein
MSEFKEFMRSMISPSCDADFDAGYNVGLIHAMQVIDETCGAKADTSGGMTDDELRELNTLVQASKHDEYALWRVMNIMAENAEWLLDRVMQAR